MSHPVRFLLPTMLGTLALLAISAPAQHDIYTFRGNLPEERLGRAVSRAGDVNRDGYADILVGMPGSGTPCSPGKAQVLSGKEGRVLFTFLGNQAGDSFGAAVAGIDDVNGDGHPDLLVGAPCDQTASPNTGYVRVHSGKDGSVLFTVTGISGGDRFGWSVNCAGDVNRDNTTDFVVGALMGGTLKQGTVTVFSGRDASILHTFQGEATYDYFGYAVSGAGDVNRDGYADILVGSPELTLVRDNAYARVFSGKDGQVLVTCSGGSGAGFGTSVSGLGDIDGDGYADFVIGCPCKPSLGEGHISVYSGRTGQLYYTCHGESASFGQSVDSIGDVDGDRVTDLVVGEPGSLTAGPGTGCLTVWSGKNGNGRLTFSGDQPGDSLGVWVSGLGDVNGDGCPDLAAGALPLGNIRPGYVRVFSGTPLPLTTDTHLVSINALGSQVFFLDAGSKNALQVYALLGSLSGTRPGIQIGTRNLPLNPDPYFFFTVQYPNTLPLSRSVGCLDRNGKARPAFLLPPGLPAPTAGLTLHHAFLLPGTTPLFVSHAVPLTLVP